MTRTEKLLADILGELKAIRAVLAPDTKPKPKPFASVSSLTVNHRTGEVHEGGHDSDVPSQLTAEQRAAMAGRGRNTGRRRDTRPFRESE